MHVDQYQNLMHVDQYQNLILIS